LKEEKDVIFKVENEEIPANKSLLSLRSSYFKNAFSSSKSIFSQYLQ